MCKCMGCVHTWGVQCVYETRRYRSGSPDGHYPLSILYRPPQSQYIHTYSSAENVGASLETVWHHHGAGWSVMLRSISDGLNDENTMALHRSRVHLICAVLQSIYIIESVCLFVRLFVRGKRQNYGTD